MLLYLSCATLATDHQGLVDWLQLATNIPISFLSHNEDMRFQVLWAETCTQSEVALYVCSDNILSNPPRHPPESTHAYHLHPNLHHHPPLPNIGKSYIEIYIYIYKEGEFQ